MRYRGGSVDMGLPQKGGKHKVSAQRSDILAWERVQQNLRGSEDRLQQIIDTIPAMVWTVRPDGAIDYLNKVWLDYTGLSLEEGLEKPTLVVHPEDLPHVMEKWLADMAAGQPSGQEMRLRRADGEYRWFLVRSVPLRDEKGNIIKWYGSSTDIEDRKRAEDDLGRQKEILQKIFDQVPVMINFTAEDGRIKLVNREWERILGWSLKEIKTQKVDVLAECYPEPSYRHEVLNFVAAGEGRWADFKTRTRGGKLIDTTWARVRLSDGSTIGIGQNITERKRAEEALRRSEDCLRQIIDTIPTMAWSHGPDGTIDFVNRRWKDYTGLSLEEELEEPTRPMHPEDLPHIMEEWLADMAAGKPFEDEIRLRRADGEYRWFLVRTVPVRDELENIVKWFGTATEIEDRKQAETQTRALIDAIPQQIWSGLPDGTLDYCNQRWRSYKGLGLEELQGEGWQRMLHPDDRERVVNAWHKSVANGKPYEQEERHRRADGTYRWFLSRGVPLRDATGRIVRWYGTNTDIEDRKGAEVALNQSFGQLRSLAARLRTVREEERTRLAREIHDELGQALTAIKISLSSFIHELPAEKKQESESILKLVDQTIQSVRRIATELRPIILDDFGLVAAVEWAGEEFAARSGIKLRLDLPREDLVMDQDIATAIFRIFQETLTNVARHAEASEVEVRLGKDDDSIVLEVRDNGRGMNEELATGGSLGILGMRERALLLKGKLTIHGTPGIGTTVRVRIPTKEVDAT